MKTVEDFRNIIGGEEYAAYITAPFGHRFGVYPDGKVLVGEDVGNEIAEEERPVVWVSCPGVGNVDFSYILGGENTAEGSEDGYLEFADSRDFEKAVRTACTEGDISSEIEELCEKLTSTLHEDDK